MIKRNRKYHHNNKRYDFVSVSLACFIVTTLFAIRRVAPGAKSEMLLKRKLFVINFKELKILTTSCRFKRTDSRKTRMEGIITTASGGKRAAASPIASSSSKRLGFLGISPLKNLNGVKTPTDRPFRVSIEGNIGAGKSTLIKYFDTIENVETYPEPIDMWRNLNGDNLLELMYKDPEKWLGIFQSYVQLTRLKIQTSKPKSSQTTVQMFERSLQNNRFCFLEQAHRSGILHGADYAILDQWYRWLRASVDISLDLIVYLRTTPETVYQRMKARGRPEESNVSLEYLQQLHESHEKWLMSNDERYNTIPVLVLDADKSLEEIIKDYKQNERKILGYEKRGITKVDKENKDKVRKVLKLECS